MLKGNVLIFPVVEDVCELSLSTIKYKFGQRLVNRGRHNFGENIV